MEQKPKKWLIFLICLALVLTTLTVFCQMCRHDFIAFDDNIYIVGNSNVNTGITRAGLIWAFTKAHAYNWHPLTWISHMMDCQFYGIQAGGHHITNMLFHIANTVLLLLVLNLMTGSLWASAFVAAAFALHPLHVESVAWASERKDVLSTFFWMLTMLVYVFYIRRPQIKKYLLLLAVFALGLMAKQMLVTLPFVLLLLDYWPLKRIKFKQHNLDKPQHQHSGSVSISKCLLEKVPLLVLAAIAGAIVYFIQHSTEMVKSFSDYPLVYRITNAVVSYIAYAGKTFWPTNLAIFYPHPKGDLPTWHIASSVALLIGITTVAIWKIKKYPYLIVGWMWYVISLAPVIGIVQIGLHARADRYTYIPLTGLFIIIACGSRDLCARLANRKAILSTIAAIILSILAVMSFCQVRHWRNSMTLFKHATDVVEDNWWAHHYLAWEFLYKGEIDQAAIHLEEVLRIDPDNAAAKSEIGNIYLQRGRFNEAVQIYQQLLPELPENPDDLDDLDGLGVQAGQRGKLSRTVEIYTESRVNLGIALEYSGKLDESIKNYAEALRVRPNYLPARKCLANTLVKRGKLDKAEIQYNYALQINNDQPEIHYRLGDVYYKQRKFDLAVTHWTETAKLKPDFPYVFINLAWVLAARELPNIKNPDKAIEYAEHACKLTNYQLPEALDPLAAAYAATGKFKLAIETAERAIKLADSMGNKALSKEIQIRLALYKNSKPYRMP